ncbi:hypothetical protein LIHA111178_12725 [Litorimonas haliclonae]
MAADIPSLKKTEAALFSMRGRERTTIPSKRATALLRAPICKVSDDGANQGGRTQVLL